MKAVKSMKSDGPVEPRLDPPPRPGWLIRKLKFSKSRILSMDIGDGVAGHVVFKLDRDGVWRCWRCTKQRWCRAGMSMWRCVDVLKRAGVWWFWDSDCDP